MSARQSATPAQGSSVRGGGVRQATQRTDRALIEMAGSDDLGKHGFLLRLVKALAVSSNCPVGASA
jgi:hypothetical protein